MSELRSLAFDGPGGRLGGWTRGDLESGTPVLYVHPINTEGRIWERVAERLGDRPAVMPDLRGHGAASPEGPFSIAAWVDDLVAVLDHLELSQVDAVGGSIGGAMVVELAAREPERVRSIASFGGTLAVREDAAGFRAVLEERGVEGTWRFLVPQFSVAPGSPEEVVEAVVAVANRNDAETVASILDAALEVDVRDRVEAVSCQALVVNGAEDRTCPPELGREMAELLGVPHLEPPGLGHMPMIEDPDKTAELLAAHLAGAELAPRAGR